MRINQIWTLEDWGLTSFEEVVESPFRRLWGDDKVAFFVGRFPWWVVVADVVLKVGIVFWFLVEITQGPLNH